MECKIYDNWDNLETKKKPQKNTAIYSNKHLDIYLNNLFLLEIQSVL